MNWRKKLFNNNHNLKPNEKLSKTKNEIKNDVSTFLTNYQYKISFCTTCGNRLWQLKQTIFENLKVIKLNNMQMCLVNYNSKDGMDDFVWDKLTNYIKDGTLKYFYTKEPEEFNMAIAKHLSHSIADGEYLYNLDADNFIVQEEIDYINKLNNIEVYRNFNRKNLGTSGRILIKKTIYQKIGGYNCNMLSIGYYEDIDLINRCKDYNRIDNNIFYKNPIENPKTTVEFRINQRKLHKLNKNISINTDVVINNIRINGLLNGIKYTIN